MTGAKMRVYEIAKEIGIPNKDLIAKIRALGLEVNNHMSSLDADDVARIKRSLEKEKAGAEKPAQTQRLTTGAVLRRRPAADKADGDSPKVDEARPTVAAAPAAPAPVIRRRVVAEDATPAPAPMKPTPSEEAPAVSAAPAVTKRTPVVEAPVQPPVIEAPPPPAVIARKSEPKIEVET